MALTNPQTIEISLPKYALYPLTDWEIIEIMGEDRVVYLDNLITQKVSDLRYGEARQSLYLTARGKIRGDTIVTQTPEQFLLLAQPHTGESLFEFLDYYHYALEQVDVIWPSEQWLPLLLISKDLNPLLQKIDPALLKQGNALIWPNHISLHDQPIWASRCNLFKSLDTLIIWSPKPIANMIIEQLTKLGSEVIDDLFGSLRIFFEWYDSAEELAGLLVHETALQHTHVNLSKDTFIGHKVVARAQHRSKASKALYALTSPVILPLDTPIFDKNNKQIGQIIIRWTTSLHRDLYRATIKTGIVENNEEIYVQLAENQPIPLQPIQFIIK